MKGWALSLPGPGTQAPPPIKWKGSGWEWVLTRENQVPYVDVISNCSDKLSSLSPSLETAFYGAAPSGGFYRLIQKIPSPAGWRENISCFSEKKSFQDPQSNPLNPTISWNPGGWAEVAFLCTCDTLQGAALPAQCSAGSK